MRALRQLATAESGGRRVPVIVRESGQRGIYDVLVGGFRKGQIKKFVPPGTKTTRWTFRVLPERTWATFIYFSKAACTSQVVEGLNAEQREAKVLRAAVLLGRRR